LGKSNMMDWVTVEETEIKYEGILIGAYVNWYGEFISKKIASGGIVFAPARKAFVSRAAMPFKAELYADLVEFKSLVQLVGPYGVQAIDREILKFILSSVNNLKDYVSNNKNILEELKINYHKEAQANETLKKLRDGDQFVTKAIAIGNALSFRQVLHEALSLVVKEKTPSIYSIINTAFNQYGRNTFMSAELLSIDMLANECGIPLGTADQALKKFLSGSIGSADAALWDLLPFMFAASFTTNVWKDAQWKPTIEGHTNNAHTLAMAISDLIIVFKSVTSTSGDEKEIVNLLRTFVEVSSVILLRMARANWKQDKHPPVDLPSIIVFVDKFIEACPLLTKEMLESCLPYALLRNEWRSIYAQVDEQTKKGVKDVF